MASNILIKRALNGFTVEEDYHWLTIHADKQALLEFLAVRLNSEESTAPVKEEETNATTDQTSLP